MIEESTLVKLYIYCAGMLAGALLLPSGLFVWIANAPDSWSGPAMFLWLILSIPVGAVGGALAVWSVRVVLALLGVGRELDWQTASSRLTVASQCASCGRRATTDERAVSALCPGCRERLPLVPRKDHW